MTGSPYGAGIKHELCAVVSDGAEYIEMQSFDSSPPPYEP